MNQKVQQLIAQLGPDGFDFDRLQAALRTVRYTGPITYDYLNGNPMQINLGPPLKLTICHASPLGEVDKARRSGTG